MFYRKNKQFFGFHKLREEANIWMMGNILNKKKPEKLMNFTWYIKKIRKSGSEYIKRKQNNIIIVLGCFQMIAGFCSTAAFFWFSSELQPRDCKCGMCDCLVCLNKYV